METFYAIGDSHVRTFSFDSRFLPLYIGPGFANCFLTEELAERARTKVLLNLARIPRGAKILFVFGEPDVRFHQENRFGTRARPGLAPFHDAIDRYAGLLATVRETTACRPLVFNVMPSTHAERCELARAYNSLLRTRCGELGVPFVDVWNDLADRDSGLLARRFDADGIHLLATSLPPIRRALHRLGVTRQLLPDEEDFAWSFNYRIPLASDIETRLWGNKQHTAAADALIAWLLDEARGERWQSAAVLNCREGYIAFALANAGFNVAATDPDARKRRLGAKVADFWGLRNVRFARSLPRPGAGAQRPFDVVIDYNVDQPATLLRPAQAGKLLALGNAAIVVAREARVRIPAQPGGELAVTEHALKEIVPARIYSLSRHAVPLDGRSQQ